MSHTELEAARHSRRKFLLGAGGVAVAGVVGFPSAAAATGPHRLSGSTTGMVITQSRFSFLTTWESITSAVENNPNLKLVTTIDHGAAAGQIGQDLAPNRLAIFGNPALGSPIMDAGPTAGLDLPQKMQVFEAEGGVFVGYNSVQYLGSRHWTGPLPQYARVHAALKKIAGDATGNSPDADHLNTVVSIGHQPGLVTEESDASFETTWNRLVAAIEGSPASVAFTVDHGKNSGGSLRPTRLVVFGNPALGTPLMQTSPTAGLDLPLKMLVWEHSGVTRVTFGAVDFLSRRHGIGQLPQLQAATTALNNFTRAAISS